MLLFFGSVIVNVNVIGIVSASVIAIGVVSVIGTCNSLVLLRVIVLVLCYLCCNALYGTVA